MTEEVSRKAVVAPFKPKPAELEAMIRKAAAQSENVGFGRHARERMEERSVTILDVLRVLRSGHIKGEVEAGGRAGEWKCKTVKQIKGNRDLGVVTLLISKGKLFIKTVEWEDL